MVSFTILAGGNDDAFIATYLFDAVNARLYLTHQTPTTAWKTKWLTPSPLNARIIYATNGRDKVGAVQSFTVNPDGQLTAADSVSSEGASPAHTAVLSSGHVAVFNYGGGNGRIIPVSENLVTFDESSAQLITFPVPDNGASHPHQAVEYKGEIFVPDLGADTIYRLTEKDGVWSIAGDIPHPQGSGPRHIVFYNDYIYTLHELSSTLSVQPIPVGPTTTADLISTVYVVPEHNIEGAVWQTAEILIPEPTSEYPTPYIYVSNRNTGTVDPEGKGDTIAIYEHVNKGQEGETLKLINHVYTGMEQVRGMAIGEACEGGEKYLIASGVVGTGGVAVFERTEEGRNLVEVARNTDVLTRTSFLFLR